MSLKQYKKKRIIIGIAGPSGSGKTAISKKLAKEFNAKLIHLDDYWIYHKVSKIPPLKEWKKGIWEKPSATDFKKALKDIKKVKKNLIVEGLHSFNNKKLRNLFDLKIYVKIPEKLVVSRRLKKFGLKDNQKWYSKNVVVKYYNKYGKSKKRYADLILKGDKNVKINVNKIISYIKKLR